MVATVATVAYPGLEARAVEVSAANAFNCGMKHTLVAVRTEGNFAVVG
jgi:hypothetical protein